ncbi:hypothetical protein PSH74_20300 [Pseudomonas hefeiensis]|uniref:hypothetical protein n=1 Tax=Pseudomonas hefeiensis TaxID=2738125 RepID=UPI002734C77B|nr:hypothetical protein [Pseudomonas sp. FP821]WLI38552.1 hypothetical protein PSH74_20300 [Pseudomonas sp. FP821]
MKTPVFLITLLALSSPLHASENVQKRLAAGSDVELAPFQWSWMDPVTFNEEGLQKTASKKDPLRPFFLAFRLLTIYEKTGDPDALKSAKRALNFMLDEYISQQLVKAKARVGFMASTTTEASKPLGGLAWMGSSVR